MKDWRSKARRFVHKNARVDLYGRIYVVFKGEKVVSKHEDLLVKKLERQGVK